MSNPEAREAHGIRSFLAAHLSGPAGVAVWGVDVSTTDPFPVEVEAVSSAVASRVTEFHRGRACARAALRQLGIGRAAIPVGEHREPRWPEGVVGSVTHNRDVVAAAVASAAWCAGLGIDVEKADAVTPQLANQLLAPGEEHAGPALARAFCAKEAVFKAVYPAHRVYLDFREVAVTFEGDRFLARGVSGRADEVPLDDVRGRWAVVGRQLCALALLESPAGTGEARD